MRMRQVALVLILIRLAAPLGAQQPPKEIPSEYQQVLSALDRQGDFKDAVLRVNIPRNDSR